MRVDNGTGEILMAVDELVVSRLDRIEAKLDQLLARKTTRKTVVDDDFRNRMSVEFVVFDSAEVQAKIDLALGHKNAGKYNDQQLYVKNWLKKDVKHGIARGDITQDNPENSRAARAERLAGRNARGGVPEV